MQNVYNVNGLQFWNEREIRLRNQFVDHFAFTFNKILLNTNPAWRMMQVEAPILTPTHLINKNYTKNDVWFQDLTPEIRDNTRHEDLVLRPETTPGSYAYATYLLEAHSGVKPPFCIWQVGKSFRREQDNVSKNMRLKEFYQQEFQCFYTSDTMNDYHEAVSHPVKCMIDEMVGKGKATRLIPSDRLPDYSDTTIDVEIQLDYPITGGRWMELCSISQRTDFKTKAKFQIKKKLIEKNLLVLEVAIGLDRCVYSFNQK